MMILQEKNDLSYFTFEIFLPFQDKLHHGCFTRKGGVSSPPFDSLNIGLSVGDIPENVLENRRRIASHFNISLEKLFHLEQVHGLDFFIANERPQKDQKGDILLTNTKENVLMIKHADCQAAILYDPIHQALALVHAGWRGLVQKAYTKAITLMHTNWQTNPKDLLAGIAPSLGLSHSEFVSWQQEFPEEMWPFCRHNNMDLKATARNELLKAGLQKKNIEISPLCTFDNEELFFSYRRDHRTGRLATCAQLLL